MFPRFRIHTSDSDEAVGAITSTTFGKETWVGDRYLGYLINDERLISGRWHMRGDSWAFAPDDTTHIETLCPNSEWKVMDGYWGERTKLVLDTDRVWVKARLERLDHDHCAICWEAIAQGGEGYVSDGTAWVCNQCYESFVRTKSLDFIPKP